MLLRIWRERADSAERGEDRPIGGNIFAGVTLILRSPYMLGIALFVVLISTVNTLLYFEQLRLVEVNYPGDHGSHARLRAPRLDRADAHRAVAGLSDRTHRADASA